MIKKIVSELLHDIAVSIIKEARDKAPVVTGELQRSIDIISEEEGKIVVGHKANPNIMVKWQGKNVPYPLFVHEGTKAHTIKPKKKKALKTPYGPKKSVKHPGTKANPYFERAVDSYLKSGALSRTLKSFEEKVGQAVEAEIKKIKGVR